MLEKRGKVYAEPYHLLVGREYKVCGYQLSGTADDYIEIDAPVDDMTLDGDTAVWAGGKCLYRIRKDAVYDRIKAQLVKVRYSNDDQIAVMLNGDDEEMQRMQAWRDWAAEVANRIVELSKMRVGDGME